MDQSKVQVTEILPGTPEWDDSERALAAQRAREAGPAEDGCPACGQDLDRFGGNPECPACAAEPAPEAAERVKAAILAAEPTLEVRVEQTGGGTATLYVGPYDAEGRAWLALGPGSYDWAHPWASLFYLGDDATCIGPDDDGQAEPTYVSTLEAVRDYVAERLCDECHHGPHLWAPALEPGPAEFVFSHATCWAENICAVCDPTLYAQALALVGPA